MGCKSCHILLGANIWVLGGLDFNVFLKALNLIKISFQVSDLKSWTTVALGFGILTNSLSSFGSWVWVFKNLGIWVFVDFRLLRLSVQLFVDGLFEYAGKRSP